MVYEILELIEQGDPSKRKAFAEELSIALKSLLRGKAGITHPFFRTQFLIVNQAERARLFNRAIDALANTKGLESQAEEIRQLGCFTSTYTSLHRPFSPNIQGDFIFDEDTYYRGFIPTNIPQSGAELITNGTGPSVIIYPDRRIVKTSGKPVGSYDPITFLLRETSPIKVERLTLEAAI